MDAFSELGTVQARQVRKFLKITSLHQRFLVTLSEERSFRDQQCFE